jgi:hypothetical protein
MEVRMSSSPEKILNFGVDSLWLNFCYADEADQPVKQVLDLALMLHLTTWQNTAKAREEPVATEYEFNGASLLMYPHGGGARSPWRFVLRSRDLEVKIGTGKKTGYVAKARLLSNYLWSMGDVEQAIAEVHMFLCGYVFNANLYAHLSEVHLCADLVFDWSHAEWQDGFIRRSALHPHFDRDMHFVEPQEDEEGQAIIPGPDDVYMRYRPITGFSFGTHASALSAVIYNKSLYIRRKEQESDYFHDIWRRNGWDGESEVWRVEFRLKRDVLRDFEIEGVFHGVDDAYDLPERIVLMWQYCTEQWMRYVEPDANNKNRNRWETQAVWLVVQQAACVLKPIELGPVVRKRRRVKNIERIIAQIIGCSMTYYAWLKDKDPCLDEDLSTVLHELYPAGLEYIEKSGREFNKTVRKKQVLYSLIAA